MNKKFKGIISGLVIVLIGFTLGACAPKDENKEENKTEQNKKNKENEEQSLRNVNDILSMIKL